MAPKQRLAQNRMLAIQNTPTAIPRSRVTMSASRGGMDAETLAEAGPGDGDAAEDDDDDDDRGSGKGTKSGLTTSRIRVPTTPTRAEKANPGIDLSIRYHSAGLAMASVSETCRVDCQGSLR